MDMDVSIVDINAKMVVVIVNRENVLFVKINLGFIWVPSLQINAVLLVVIILLMELSSVIQSHNLAQIVNLFVMKIVKHVFLVFVLHVIMDTNYSIINV